MGQIWVQLLQAQMIERKGKLVKFQKGDFVPVGKQTGLRWIMEGKARSLTHDISQFAPSGDDMGILLIAHAEVGQTILEGVQLPMQVGPPSVPFGSTFLWNPDVPLRSELIPIGFSLLNTWEFCCPLLPYEQLADSIGSDKDKADTKQLIGDLRVPLYDPRMMFAQKVPAAESTVRDWHLDTQAGVETHHALLRAIFTHKPLVLALPPTWSDPSYRADEED